MNNLKFLSHFKNLKLFFVKINYYDFSIVRAIKIDYRLNKLNNRRMNSNKISRLQDRHHDFLLNENLKHFSIAANLCVQYLFEHFYFTNRNNCIHYLI